MYKEIKCYIKNHYPIAVKLRRALTLANWWRLDICSALFSMSTKLKSTPYGFKLVGSSSIHHVAMQDGIFEPEETDLFKKYFLMSDVFVDVGANIGFYTCLARNAGKHVIAVEPLPKNLKHLYSNLLANNWNDVEVFPVGVGREPGMAMLYGGSSTGASLIGSWAGASKIFRRIIPISTLDVLLGDRFAGERLLMKIDVEGVEYSVILGAMRVMQLQPKPIWVVEICLTEFHPDGMNPNFQDIFNLFWQNGYEARTANKDNKLIHPDDVARWVECRLCDSGTINYIFVPAE
jgi:FkbM family methyltransferase